MDLMHDWKALNDVLFHNQTLGQSLSSKASSLIVLEEGGKVIDGVSSNGGGFSDFGIDDVSSSKEKLDQLAAKYGTEQVVVLTKKNLDQYIIEAAALGPNYYQQLQALRKNILDEIENPRKSVKHGKGSFMVSRRHFVLDLFGLYLKRVLPGRFNLLIFVDQRPSIPFNPIGNADPRPVAPLSYRAILLSYVNGQIDQFFEPDFSSLHEDRLVNWQKQTDAIGQYLEQRYILPCFGVFMFDEDWTRCLDAADKGHRPWRLFARYHDDKRATVYPNRFLAKALLAFQRLMVYLGRL